MRTNITKVIFLAALLAPSFAFAAETECGKVAESASEGNFVEAADHVVGCVKELNDATK